MSSIPIASNSSFRVSRTIVLTGETPNRNVIESGQHYLTTITMKPIFGAVLLGILLSDGVLGAVPVTHSWQTPAPAARKLSDSDPTGFPITSPMSSSSVSTT